MYEQDAMSKSGWPFFMAFRYGGAKVIEDAIDSSKHAGATNTSTTRSIHKVFDSRSTLHKPIFIIFLHGFDVPGAKVSYRIRVFAIHLTITSVTGISDMSTSRESTQLFTMTRFSSLDAAVTCGNFHEDAMEMVPGKTVAPENQRPLSYNVGNVQTRCIDLLSPALAHPQQ
jgi:hypothetical protein